MGLIVAAEPISLAVLSRSEALNSVFLTMTTSEPFASDVFPPAPIKTSVEMLVLSLLLSKIVRS